MNCSGKQPFQPHLANHLRAGRKAIECSPKALITLPPRAGICSPARRSGTIKSASAVAAAAVSPPRQALPAIYDFGPEVRLSILGATQLIGGIQVFSRGLPYVR
jgi:hypothetical protein